MLRDKRTGGVIRIILANSAQTFLQFLSIKHRTRLAVTRLTRIDAGRVHRANAARKPRSRAQMGGSLIEALVALLVFSVGALGIAALQVTTVLRVDDTKQHTIALFKAQELLERIRASESSSQIEDPLPHYIRAVNNTSLTSLTSYTGHPNFQCGAAPAMCSGAQQCAVAELAQFDVWTTFCDPVTGIATELQTAGLKRDASTKGAVSLKGLDVALLPTAQGHNLYVRWVARDTEQNQSLADGPTRMVNLCGESMPLDVRLNVYCVKAQ